MEQGRNTNRLSWILIGGFLVSIVAINLVLFSFSSDDDKPFVLFGLFVAILPTVFLVYFWWPRGIMGALLLRLHVEAVIQLLGIVACVLLTFGIAINIYAITKVNSSASILNFSIIFGYLLVILLWLSILVRRNEIREKGINGPFSFTSWEAIESYRWQRQNPTILLLTVKGRKLINPKKFAVPTIDRGAVNRILADRVLSWQEQPTNS